VSEILPYVMWIAHGAIPIAIFYLGRWDQAMGTTPHEWNVPYLLAIFLSLFLFLTVRV
jgi:hypothetical protein